MAANTTRRAKTAKRGKARASTKAAKATTAKATTAKAAKTKAASRAPKLTQKSARMAPPPVPRPPPSGTSATEVELRARIRQLEVMLDAERRERERAEQRAAEIETEARRYYEHYVNGEIHSANVANLFVASSRINETLRREDVLEAIQEIVINLIGSEELAIYELSDGVLRMASSFGMAADAAKEVPLGRGIVGRTAQRGETWVAGAGGASTDAAALPTEHHLTACIPLRVEGRVIGVIAIFRLLGHKRGLEDVDRELFALLGTQAAAALKLAARS